MIQEGHTSVQSLEQASATNFQKQDVLCLNIVIVHQDLEHINYPLNLGFDLFIMEIDFIPFAHDYYIMNLPAPGTKIS